MNSTHHLGCVINWVLQAWDSVKLSAVTDGMNKLILQAMLEKAHLLKALVAKIADAAELAKEQAGAEATLILEAPEDTSCAVEGEGSESEAEVVEIIPSDDAESSDDEPEDEIADPTSPALANVSSMSSHCYNCERPLRPTTAAMCRGCPAWVHKGCLVNGVCIICAYNEELD
eukprot:EG_transcript_35102